MVPVGPMRKSILNNNAGLVISIVLAFLIGCARTVVVPREELTRCVDCKGLYRIHTTDGEYLVQRFAVSDSTIVISELARSDGRYGVVGMPVTLTLKDVTSVSKMPTDKDYAPIVVACFVLFGLAVFLVHEIEDAFPATD